MFSSKRLTALTSSLKEQAIPWQCGHLILMLACSYHWWISQQKWLPAKLTIVVHTHTQDKNSNTSKCTYELTSPSRHINTRTINLLDSFSVLPEYLPFEMVSKGTKLLGNTQTTDPSTSNSITICQIIVSDFPSLLPCVQPFVGTHHPSRHHPCN